MSGAANAIVNRTGMFYHSKITDPYGALTDNIISNLNGTWTGETLTGAVVPADYTVNLSEAGPAKGAIGQKIAVPATYVFPNPGPATACFAFEAVSAKDLSTYEAVTFYIRSDVAIAGGDLYLCLSTNSATVTTAYSARTEKLLLPAIPKTTMTVADVPDNGDEADEDKWVRVCLKLAAPSSDTAITAIGLYWAGVTTIDPGAINIYVQGLRGMHNFEGRTGFSISESVDEVDVTDYESKFTREFDTTFSAWTCSTEGHKEGAPPLDKGRKYVIAMAETDTVGQVFIGDALYTGFNPSGTFAESVKYPYQMRGTGFLSKPLS